jgi:hypothetical protein
MSFSPYDSMVRLSSTMRQQCAAGEAGDCAERIAYFSFGITGW